MTERPRVRVVLVNYNGGELTMRSLQSLRKADWPAECLEVVLVDNASSDGVVDAVRHDFPEVQIIQSPVNTGFAGGCNLGLQDLEGIDHAALLNPDAVAEPGWLAPLVDALEADPTAGAACSKILFEPAFVEVLLDSPTSRPGWGDQRELGVRVSGVRIDGRETWRQVQLVSGFWGPEYGQGEEAVHQWTAGHALLRVPVPRCGDVPSACFVRLAADDAKVVTVSSGEHRVQLDVGTAPAWHEIPLGGERLEVINNAGSVLRSDGYGADRGYLERDTGQHDISCDVFAWCGASVLLSTRYLRSVGLFDEHLFLYYEDFDLSWKGGLRGWRYPYVPTSLVHHVHSASSVETSELTDYHKERNRLLVLTRYAPATMVVRAVLRHVLVTASYARRDIVSRALRRRRPRVEMVRRRLRAEAGYLRLLPSSLIIRRKIGVSREARHRFATRWLAED